MNWCGAGGITGNSGDGKCDHRSEACDVWEGPRCFTYIIHLYNNYRSNKTIWSREPRAPRDWWRLGTGSQCKLFKNKSANLGSAFFLFFFFLNLRHKQYIAFSYFRTSAFLKGNPELITDCHLQMLWLFPGSLSLADQLHPCPLTPEPSNHCLPSPPCPWSPVLAWIVCMWVEKG